MNSNFLNPNVVNSILLTLLAGAMFAVQGVVNTRLGRELGNPMLATMVSFLVGMTSIMTYCLLTRISLPASETLGRIPWWAWTGGFLGACIVSVVILMVPKIGVGSVVGFTVGGQLMMSVVLDHFGLLGLNPHPINPGRLIGMILLMTGVVLLKRF